MITIASRTKGLLFFIRTAAFLSVLFPITVRSAQTSEGAPKYHSAGIILIKGQGGWDALSIDPASHLLFVSHSDRVVVIDTRKNQVIREILDTPGVHGIALAPDLNRAFSSNGQASTVSVIDLQSFKTRTKIKVGQKPDAIVYEPRSHEVYAFNGDSHSVSVIDAKAERVVTTVDLPGSPEFAVVDAARHQIFVNIEDKDSVAAIDTVTHKVSVMWEIEGCTGPSGIALDAENQRIFSVCENQKMVMLDATNGKSLASVPTGEGTDGADFDPASGLAFSSNGKSGTITVAKETSPEHLAVVQTVQTQRGARTLVLNPQDHRLYLPTADFHPAEAGSRPTPVDGSQRVLIFEP